MSRIDGDTGRDDTAGRTHAADVRESEERYQSLIENAIDAVFLATPDGAILEANPAAIEMFGWTEDELRELGVDALAPVDSDARESSVRELAAKGRFRGRQILLRRDGSTLVGDVSIGRFIDRSGAARSTVVIRDVTEQDAAARTLRAAESKFRTLVEHALIGVFIAKGERLVYCNPEVSRILGYDEETLLAMPSILEVIVKEDRDRVARLMRQRVTMDGGTRPNRLRAIRVDGEVIEIEVLGSAIEYAGGTAILGTARDITEQQRASEGLQKSEIRYRTLVEEAQDIIFTCDLEGRITSLNHAFEEITGWSREEWIGRSYEDVVEPESVAPARDHFEGILHGGLAVRRESMLRTVSGKPVLIEGTARPLVIGGTVVGTLGIVRDISERRRMELALERSARFTALGRLAATIAHEFNNVLMGVQATVDLMQRCADATTISRGLESLKAGIVRGGRMTQEVLQFTRMPEPHTELFQVVPLIQSMMSELQGLAGPDLRVRSDLRASPQAAVAGDRGQLQQVITNLVLNARDATPRGGTITIGVEERASEPDRGEQSVVISVADTGSGIPAEMLTLIFEPLFTTKRSGGTGLGLAIVSQIVEKHGGTIHVESEPGRGTTFRIGIPIASRAESVEPVMPPRRVGTVERLLIVDDEPMITDGLSAVLELDGIATHVVALGGEVESAVESFRPEAVLLDLNLPDISGAQVYEILMSRWPDLPVIISSGHTDESGVRELTRGARAAFLPKPYDMDTLLETLAVVAELRRPAASSDGAD